MPVLKRFFFALVVSLTITLGPNFCKNLSATENESEETIALMQHRQGTAAAKQPAKPAAPPALPQASTNDNLPAAPLKVAPNPKGWQGHADDGAELSNEELSPELAALKKAVRDQLTNNARRTASLQNSKPSEVLAFCYPYGTETLVFLPGNAPQSTSARTQPTAGGSYIYSIGALCWNYPAASRTLLRAEQGRVFAKLGFGYQDKPSSFLGMLAMSKVSEKYEIRIGYDNFTIADLIEGEKWDCSSGSIQSLKLLGLSFYVPCESTWKGYDGETWSLARLAAEEYRRRPDQGSSDVTDHLLALTAVIRAYEENAVPLDSNLADAKKYLETCRNFALEARNEQGLWHPQFFLYRGTGADIYETLISSGHILRWLVYSLPEDQLENPQVMHSVTALAGLVSRVPGNLAVSAMTEKQIEALSVSLHALSIYNQRVFASKELNVQKNDVE